jgi:multidrug efflux pump subunit AcrA (membrane-fusion protein)
LVPTRSGARRVGTLIALLLLLIVLLLRFVPWQQSVNGSGIVSVYAAMSRPQTIEAQIAGRLVRWEVQEGQTVRAGQQIALIEDTEARFLDPQRVARARRMLAAQRLRRQEELRRASQIETQIARLNDSQGAQVPAAGERAQQARQRQTIARRSLAIAEKNFAIAERVARLQASERVRQAKIRVEQARQAQIAAQENYDKEALRRERIARLLAEGLRSGQEDEFAERDLISRRTQLVQAQQAVVSAERDVAVLSASEAQVDLEVQRAREQVLQAQAALDVALRDISIAGLDQSRIAADTSAAINVAQSNLLAARAAIAAIDDTIAKTETDLQNLQGRVQQQEVRAPCDGRIVRIGAAVGPGQTVKAGTALAVVLPDVRDQAVELTLDGADAPLVAIGRHVRLQFNGWPALQITGFPRAAVGTFAGRVTMVDPIDDGTGRVRIWVQPDTRAIEAGDQPWPSPSLLRPGTDAVGWILLDTVPLGSELWRRFNAFPPGLRDDPSVNYDDGGKDSEKGGSKSKRKNPLKNGAIKLPKG